MLSVEPIVSESEEGRQSSVLVHSIVGPSLPCGHSSGSVSDGVNVETQNNKIFPVRPAVVKDLFVEK